MIRAIGYSLTRFDPASPGRLCRGRERWVEPYPGDGAGELHRVVISGATFSDDTARDARRGLLYSGISAGELLEAIYPGTPLMAFCEQGHPLHVPDGCILEEHYMQPRLGGRHMDPCVRWRLPVSGAQAVDARCSLESDGADGFVPLPDEPDQDLEDALFLLTGQGERLTMPVRRFQPGAIPAVLDRAAFLVCIHLDKHAPALGIYSRVAPPVVGPVEDLAAAHGILAVPFSIPPMLARWDRALFELRMEWRRRGERDFPVPPGESSSLRNHAMAGAEE